MGRRRGRLLNDFVNGWQVGSAIGKSINDAMVSNKIAGVDEEFTPTTTETASGEEALNAAQSAKQNALQGAVSEEEIAKVDTAYQPTLDALSSRRQAPAGLEYSMGTGNDFQQRAQPFSGNEVRGAKAQARADIYTRAGREDDATRVMANEAKRRTLDDDQQIRNLLTDPSGKPHVTPFVNDSTTEAPKSVQGSGARPAMPGLQRQAGYLETVGPRVMDEYLRQGKIAEARAWRDFSESEQGHQYANEFAKAQRLVTAGDYETAAPVLEGLYNRSYPDGRQAKLTSIGDGSFKLDVIDQATGKPLGSKTMTGADMGKLAMGALSPTKLVEFTVQQQAKRDAEAASLNKSIQLEELRQQGQEVRDDRRDDRLNRQIGAMDSRLSRQLQAKEQGGGLTAAQQRANFEIDAAREMVAGLTDEDIRQRTTSTMATGRENPNFDPRLATAAKLAGRRKLGDDPEFDARTGKQPSFAGKPLGDLTDGQLQQFSKAAGTDGRLKIDGELARRSLAGMPGMEGHKIGEYVEGKGFKVLDSQGRPVSYLRRRQQ